MQHGDKAFFTLAATDVDTGHTGADFKYGDVLRTDRQAFDVHATGCALCFCFSTRLAAYALPDA